VPVIISLVLAQKSGFFVRNISRMMVRQLILLSGKTFIIQWCCLIMTNMARMISLPFSGIVGFL